MRLAIRALLVVTVLALAVAPASADVVVFTLDPLDGALYGQPGQALGWGLTIQNDSPGWLVIANLGFTYEMSQGIGIFTDFLTPKFQFPAPAVAPGDTWSQMFDASHSKGLGSYEILDFAVPGDRASGYLDVIYDIHSIDPNAPDWDPFNDTVQSSQARLPASVTYETASTVPEPGTLTLLIPCLAFVAAGRLHLKQRGGARR